MDFSTYQKKALETDQVPSSVQKHDLIVPILGLAGEAGELLSEYKKHLRDGEAHLLFKERVAEELGDMLWYIANVASKFDLDLGTIAEKNLKKTRDRWGSNKSLFSSFDVSFPDNERLPRQFTVEIREVQEKGRTFVRTFVNNIKMGDDLTDNSYNDDGYRYHDVFHFAFAAVLGWSPIVRGFLKKKRKSDPMKDEVEDGGRAAVIEEGIAALIFDYAQKHNFLRGVQGIDYRVLQSIKSLTSHLEVQHCSLSDWQKAILNGYQVWNEVVKNRGGIIKVDMDEQKIVYVSSSK